ncbi:MAG: hypothetical protein ACXW3D_09065 [Caulobacteraceae bacterium]
MEFRKHATEINARVKHAVESWVAWAYIFAPPIALVTVVVKNMSAWFPRHWGWPEAVLVALAIVCVVALVASVTLAAWRYFKPLAQTAQSPVGPHQSGDWLQPDSLQINSLVATGARNAEAIKAVEKAFAEELRLLREQVAALSNQIVGVDETTDGGIQLIGDRLTPIETAVANLQKESERTYARFLALNHREHIEARKKVMNELAEHLDSIVTNGEIDERKWEGWKRERSNWDSHLRSWAAVAASYVPDAEERVKHTEEAQYLLKWSFDDAIFPNSTAVYLFKTYRIREANFQSVSSDVSEAIRTVLFS